MEPMIPSFPKVADQKTSRIQRRHHENRKGRPPRKERFDAGVCHACVKRLSSSGPEIGNPEKSGQPVKDGRVLSEESILPDGHPREWRKKDIEGG
jgi:hypothetical protein